NQKEETSKMEEEKSKDNAEMELQSIPEQQSCFDKNWILQLNKQEPIRDVICLICKQVANNPMEINCTQHKNMDESLIVGENCLNIRYHYLFTISNKTMYKIKLENETFKVELQLKGKKDEEIAHLKQQLDQYQKENLQLIFAQASKNDNIIIMIKQKTTFVEIEKLKKDIESKDNEINKIKQEIQWKQKQIIQQIHENKEEQTQNIIDTSSTLDFQLLRSFQLLNTFTGHTKA
ncbi:hypothetical protein RFI_35161, partial [Reticulomyxa filosa]